MGVTEDGIKGEQLLFKWLKSRSVDFFQPDAIGGDIVYEAKHQERFKKPPFDGHGLPYWQVRARLKFAGKKNMRAMLVVFDKETDEVFYQYFDVLEAGRYYDTRGNKPRRIYPLTSFINDNQKKLL